MKRWIWAVFFIASAILCLTGIFWGLPAGYNADEPHIMNLAVSFGGGSLRPAFFKYPTLYPYLLAFFYGLYFVIWSGFGCLHTVADFIGLYAWQPTMFYLIGRTFSAVCALSAVAVMFRSERRWRPTGWPWAALLLAFCPLVVELAHAAKPDCLMVLFVCIAWSFILRLYHEGGRRWHWAAGLALGLAMSSQYTSVFVCAAAVLAHFLSKERQPRTWLWEGAAAVGLGFIGGSPYILLDFPNFWASMRDLADLAGLSAWDRGATVMQVLRNVWEFAGAWSLAGLGLALGAIRLWRVERGLALVFLGPIAAYVLGLGNNPDGSGPRYLMGAFPGLALLAAEGLSWLAALTGRWTAAAVLAGAIGPGLWWCAGYDRGLLLPDTRGQATQWLRSHVPPGKTLLMDLPHAAPDLWMTREQVEALAEQTRRAGSPRARLYQGMVLTHPGGGWRIYRIQRSARDMRTSPRQVQLAQADAPTLDVAGGLPAAQALGVEYVVLSEYGANPRRTPQLAAFFSDLERQAVLERRFDPVPGRVAGPGLKIYRIAGTKRRA
ncbi:MAG: glycosyltransferase family 39 protein [Elusimicrobiota bacterium]|jgi:hypothetical protein